MLGLCRSFARAAQACRQDHSVLQQIRGTCSRVLAPPAASAGTRPPARLASQSSAWKALDHVLLTPKKPLVFAQASHLGTGNNEDFVSASGLVAFRRLLNTTAGASQNDKAAEAAQASLDVLAFDKGDPVYEDKSMPPEEAAYWEDVLKRCHKDQCLVNIRRLDMRWRLGLDPNFKVKEKPNCYDTMIKGKVRHPDAVVLVQVGSFYECAGIDAIILAEWCGLNFMGGTTLKAGLPLENVHVVLGQLRQHGLQIAVYEEDGDTPGGKTKYRRFTQLVNAENPVYLYKYAEGSRDLDMVTPAICGLSSTSRGYTVYQYIPLSSSVVLHEGLTLDAAWGHCNYDRSTTPVVYLHRPHDAAPQQVKQLADVKKRFAPGTVHWRDFTAFDGLQGFTGAVLKNKGLPADTQLEVKRRDWSAGISGVRPLYYSTALQLGLVEKSGGLPSLLDALLPAGARKINRDALLNILTCPPPYHVTMSVRQAMRLMMTTNAALPGFCQRGLTPSKLLLVLEAREGNAPFFQGLHEDLWAVAHVLGADRSPETAALVEAAWPLLLHTTNQPAGSLTQEQVLGAVEATLHAISQTVAPASTGQSKRGSSGSADSSIDLGASNAAGKQSNRSSRAAKDDSFTRADARREANAIFTQLFAGTVLWDKRVRCDDTVPQAMQGVMQEYLDAAEHLLAVLGALLWAAHRGSRGKAILNKLTYPLLLYDSNMDKNSVITLRLRSDAVRKALAGGLQLQALTTGVQLDDLPPQVLRKPVASKRKSSAKTDVFTCDALEEALVDYLDATGKANSIATAVLKQLAADLSVHKVELHAALELGILLSTLVEHSRAASAAGWSLPLVGAKEQQDAGVAQPQSSGSSSGSGVDGKAAHDGVLQLRQLWPYWMSGRDSSTVKNDICGNTMMLLTGPNMAGKSTVLRAVAAAALTGSVGLAVPAELGSCLPLLDAIMLRTFSGDAPQEGLSAYGVEMTEMATVDADALPSSLVLIDELGKGTEVVSGTALAAAILQKLARKHVMGVFATHLHLLVPMLADVPNLQPYRMEVVARDTPGGDVAGGGPAADGSHLYRLKPTWRLLPGHCFESLAFSVARDCGLSEDVLRASEAYYSRIMQEGHSSGGAYDLIVQVAQAASSINSTSSAINISSSTAAAGNSGSDSWSDGDRCGDESVEGAAAPAELPDQADACAQQQQQQQPEQTDAFHQRHGRMWQLLRGGEVTGSDSSSCSGPGSLAPDLDGARVSVHKLVEELRPLLLTPSPVEAASDTAAVDAGTAEAAVDTTAADAGAPLRRRRRNNSGGRQQTPDPLPQQQQTLGAVQQQQSGSADPLQQPQSGSSGSGAVEYGAVCEVLPGMQPPALHEGQSVIYMLYTNDAWWYGGETQGVRKRLQSHRKAKRFAQPVAMWYVVLHPGVDRKVVQARMILQAERMGMRLLSNHDARMARRK